MGRILARAGDEQPLEFSHEAYGALYWRPLPDRYRGIAPNLRGLAGTWAVEPDYAGKVRRIAKAIREGG
jgi:hypothetical protein